MKTEVNVRTGRTVRVFETTEERLDWQNANYRKFRDSLENDPVKLADYRNRKKLASQKCNAKKKARIAELEAKVAELTNS